MAQNQNNPPVISFGFYLFCLLIGVIFLGAACLLLPVFKDLKNQEKKLNFTKKHLCEKSKTFLVIIICQMVKSRRMH